MEEFMIYLVKVGVSLGVFLFIYFLFFRSATFFRFNRIFLLAGIVFSFVVPTIKNSYNVLITIPQIQFIEDSTIVEEVSKNQPSAINIWSILFIIYVTGIVLLLMKNIKMYHKIYKLARKGKKSIENDTRIIENKSVTSPFTFFNYVFINSDKLNDTERNLILKHEITHINQKHWIDLLCGECMLLLQWFNPLVWVYIHFLKENHEFLADKSVIDSGTSPALYQAVLLNQEFQIPVFKFSSSFNYLKPLNRLNMMKKEKSASWKRISALLIVPAFGVLLWASAEPNYVYITEETEKEYVVQDTVPLNGKPINITVNRTSFNNDSLKVVIVGNKSDENKSDKKTLIIQVANDTAQREKITSSNMNFMKDLLIILDGQKTDKFNIQDIAPESIDNISVLKDKSATDIYGEEGKNGVVIIQTKEYIRNNPDKKLKRLDFNIKVNNAKELSNNLKNPLLIIDGKEELATSIDLIKIDPNSIESIKVYKGEEAIEEYGEKGKNGVIVVTSKK